MNPVSAFSKLLGSFKSNGLVETLNIVRKNFLLEYWQFENARFDRKYNVDTGGSIESTDLGIDSPNVEFGVRYEPTTLRTFRGIMTNLPDDLSDFTLVDFGSGKGRVLLLASHYNFRNIVGVEYAKDLHDIALRNIRTYRGRKPRCLDVKSVHTDASVFPIPPAPCVFYFYQPFVVEVMDRVLTNIKESFLKHPRKMFLVFLHPHRSLDRAKILAFADRKETNPLPFDPAWLHVQELEIYTSGTNR